MIDKIKKRIFQAMKDKNNVERDILRLLVGEVERTGKNASEENCIDVVKKMIKGLDISIDAAGDTRLDFVNQMKSEKNVLNTLLPKTMSISELQLFVDNNNIIINSEIGEGRSTGNFIKALKNANMNFDNKDVKIIISKILKGKNE